MAKYNYIKEDIIKPLDLYLAGSISDNRFPYSNWRYTVSNLRKDKEQFYEVREALKPYYHRLFMADKDFFRNGNSDAKVKYALHEAIEREGDDAGSLFADLDVIKAAENWAERLAPDNHAPTFFFLLIKSLLKRDYKPDWEKLFIVLRDKLVKSRSYGHFKTNELYCILMGITLIERSNLTRDKKNELEELMHGNWQFIKYMYSVLIHYIVGMKVKNFAAVAKSVCCKSYEPYIHWFYKAFNENFDKICPEEESDRHDGRSVRDQAMVYINKMEEIIKKTNPSTELDELFDILFPIVFENLFNQSRPKTYEELEAAIDDLTIRYNNVLEQLAKAVKDVESEAITPEDLTEAFLRFPRDMALTLFGSVSNLLTQNKTWQKYAPTIQKQILNKKEEPKSLTYNVQGDYVIDKKVDNQVNNVSAGGTGICTNKIGKE
jgi:hypothetical protein